MHDTQPQTPPELSVVVPVYESCESLQPLTARILEAFAPSPSSIEIILVNDGSRDGSWEVIERLAEAHPNVKGMDLRRNFGQDNAILAGLREARGRYVAIMDDDLQHDPADLPRMLDAVKGDADVVYATYRDKRQSTWKNVGSWINGKTAEWLLGKPKHIYLSPYKIIRAEVAEAICLYDGPYPYVDGLLFQVTSRFSDLPVAHHPRPFGRGHYSLAKSIRVWLRLLSSFSVQPLRLVTWCGLGLAALGVAGVASLVLYRLTSPENFYGAATGWASLMVTILVIGGAQMVFLGVIGEYVGRTYLNVNKKPQTLVRDRVNLAPRRDAARPRD